MQSRAKLTRKNLRSGLQRRKPIREGSLRLALLLPLFLVVLCVFLFFFAFAGFCHEGERCARISRGMALPPPHGFPGCFPGCYLQVDEATLRAEPSWVCSTDAQREFHRPLQTPRSFRRHKKTGSRQSRLEDLDLLGYAHFVGSALRFVSLIHVQQITRRGGETYVKISNKYLHPYIHSRFTALRREKLYEIHFSSMGRTFTRRLCVTAPLHAAMDLDDSTTTAHAEKAP